MPSVTNKQLIDAAKAGDLSVLKEWKKQNKTQNEGDGVNFKTNDGSTPLHHACSKGRLECAKYLIRSCEANINCKNNDGWTPLHDACYNGQLECVKYLIESCEADINCKSNHGWTPLHWACYNRHLECVEYLVESANADTDIQNNGNKTPLDVIGAKLPIKMIKRLDHLSHRNSQLQKKNEHLEQHLEREKKAKRQKEQENKQLKREKEAKRQKEQENEKLKRQLEREKEAKRQKEQENEKLKRQSERKEQEKTQKEQENEQLKQQLERKEEENEQLKRQLERKEEEKTQKEQENEQLKQQLEQKEESMQHLLSKSQQENEQLKRKLKQHLKISIDQDRCAAVHAEAIADVTFLCGQGDDQQPIKANSGVLRVTVPSIQTLINSGIQHQCAHDGAQDTTEPIQTTVPLPNLQPKHVRYVLQCIYTGEISFNNNTQDFAGDDDANQPTPTLTGQDDLQQLILVANEFGFWRLKLVLEAELAHKHLTEDTMIDMLIFAHQYNCVVLKDAAMRMAGEHENTLFTHPDFKKLFPHQQLMGGIHVMCSGGAESDGIDDKYSQMSIMDLYKVVDEDVGTAQVDSYMDQVTLVDFVRSLNIKSSKVIEMDGAATEDLNPDRATAMAFLPWLLVLLLALRLPMPQDLLYSGAVGLISSFLMSLSDAPHLRSLFVTARHSSLAPSSASSASSSSLAMVAFIDAGWRAILCAAATCLITSLLHCSAA